MPVYRAQAIRLLDTQQAAESEAARQALLRVAKEDVQKCLRAAAIRALKPAAHLPEVYQRLVAHLQAVEDDCVIEAAADVLRAVVADAAELKAALLSWMHERAHSWQAANAAMVLVPLAQSDAVVRDAMLQALASSHDVSVHRTIVKHLGRLAWHDADVRAALTRFIQDERHHPTARAAAVSAMCKARPKPGEADAAAETEIAATLAALLTRPAHYYVREEIIACATEGNEALRDVPVERICADDFALSEKFALLLTTTTAQDANAREAMLALLADPAQRLLALAALVPAARNAAVQAAVLGLLGNGQCADAPECMSAALRILGAVAGESDKAMQAAMGLLEHESATVRASSVRALAPAAPTSSAVRSRLVAVMWNDDDPRVRLAATKVLGTVAAQYPEIRETLHSTVWGIEDKGVPCIVAEEAIRALALVSARDKDFARLVMDAARRNPCLTKAAADALAPFAEECPLVREQLMAWALGAKTRPGARKAAVHALSPLTGRDDVRMTLLAVAVDDTALLVREAALRALVPLATQHEEVAFALWGALAHDAYLSYVFWEAWMKSDA